ncbi:MAG: hypothetical protein QGF53_14515, partial [Alphaproteobacteria bacterium]|nr:hypothetical protein [Alphaproteobacteria bacterium]
MQTLWLPALAAAALLTLVAACTDSVPPPPETVQDEPPAPVTEELPVVPATEVDIEPLNLPAPEVPLQVEDDVAPGTVRVAILLPLSGTHAGMGAALLDAAQLALFDHAGDDFVLLPKDTGGTGFG